MFKKVEFRPCELSNRAWEVYSNTVDGYTNFYINTEKEGVYYTHSDWRNPKFEEYGTIKDVNEFWERMYDETFSDDDE